MSRSATLHTQLAAVVESLVHAAVAELKKLVEGSSALLLSLGGRNGRGTGEEQALPDRLQDDTQDKMVRIGATGHGALGNIQKEFNTDL